MKKLALFVTTALLLAMASCVSHKTCPTYMKNTQSSDVITASADLK